MALIKPAPGITDITGKLAGNVFKRDASGLHVVSMQRQLHKPSRPEQKKQRAWYGGHKRHERYDPPPKEPDDPPKDIYTARVYSLSNATTYRDPSVFQPPGAPEPENPELRVQCAALAHEIWQTEWGQYGITLTFVSELIYHYWHIAHFTWGLIHAEAVTEALGLTVEFCNKIVAIGKAIVSAAWIATIVACLIYSIGEWFAGHWGTLYFDKWNMLLRTNDKLYWAGLMSHGSPEMYTVAKGPEVALPIYGSYYEIERDFKRAVYFEPGKVFQFLTSSIAWWYTWTFGNIHCVIIADAHPVEYGEYRFQGDEFIHGYLNMPVGYWQTPETSLDYLNNFHNMFVPNP